MALQIGRRITGISLLERVNIVVVVVVYRIPRKFNLFSGV